MKRLILALLLSASAFGALYLSVPAAQADPKDCAAVLCPVCPPGTVFSPTPGNCCRCLPN